VHESDNVFAWAFSNKNYFLSASKIQCNLHILNEMAEKEEVLVVRRDGSPPPEGPTATGWLMPEGLQQIITTSVAEVLRNSPGLTPSSPAGTSNPPGTSTLGKLCNTSLASVMTKRVAKIIEGEFVDMAELLRDNIEAERRRAADCSSSSSHTSHSHRREVPDFLSWLQCFGTYASIVVSHTPENFHQLMVYQTLMIHEAWRCGSNGWQGYDTIFRRLAATVPSTDWEQLNSDSDIHGPTKT